MLLEILDNQGDNADFRFKKLFVTCIQHKNTCIKCILYI